jgi:hypothetical protein
VAWDEPYSEAGTRIAVRRFTPGGTPDPAWPAGGVGVGVLDLQWSDRQPSLVPDGTGGLYVAWWRQQALCPLTALCIPCSCPSDQFATHLGVNGGIVAGWPEAGIDFGDPGTVAADATGGLLIGTTSVNSDRIPGPMDRRGVAVRVLPDGSPASGWSLAGNPVCSEKPRQSTPAIVADGSGGTYVSWIDSRTFEPVLYLSRLTSSGSIAEGWPATGSIAAVAAVSPWSPVLTPGRAGEAVLVWADARSGSPVLYAERARPGPAGPPAPRAGLGFTVTDIRPNPARGAFWATVSLPEAGDATLELLDIMGRVLESRTIPGGRTGVLLLNSSGRLRAGVYWLRLRQPSGQPGAGMRSAVARVALVP